jgi:hypothetical protein
MATVQHPTDNLSNKLSWYLNRAPHSVWDSFSAAEQQQMVEDDLFAGRSVSLLLSAVVTVGMLMAAASLAIVLWAS